MVEKVRNHYGSAGRDQGRMVQRTGRQGNFDLTAETGEGTIH
jgi:hypothetical protein